MKCSNVLELCRDEKNSKESMKRPNHSVATISPMPCSAKVGTAGKNGERVGPLVARTRMSPAPWTPRYVDERSDLPDASIRVRKPSPPEFAVVR